MVFKAEEESFTNWNIWVLAAAAYDRYSANVSLISPKS